jgi:hypothetical protein
MSSRIRSVGVAALMLAGLVGATACDPWVPPAQLAVTTGVDGPDLDPGDGVCEVTLGVGDCSLRAAIDEGNALGAADIALPAGSHPVPFGASITGSLSITEVGTGTATIDGWFTIEEGAQLAVDGIGSYGIPGARFLVKGTFIGQHLTLAGLESSGQVVVAPTGLAVLDNTILVHVFGSTASLQNQGTVIMRNTALRSWINVGVNTPAVSNSGRVIAASSVLQSCTGTLPESRGSNTDDDGSCGLTAPGDLPNRPLDVAVHVGVEITYDLNPGSPLIDAIPVGVNGCGDDLVDDQARVVRPQDGDGDGVAACDIGARERPAGA